jgi:hypothetical protein
VESVSSQACTESQNEKPWRIVTCDPHDLRPHPSYARHGLTVPACKLSALRERGDRAFAAPVTITHDPTIIDGYARWEFAKESKRPILHCIEYELSEAEALQWLLQKQRRSNGFNAFSRIMLALDLEQALTEKAWLNQQNGGKHKGWSKLTEAEQVHVRSEIANAAAVSVGNVTKVKQLKERCALEYIAALYNDEISIHWAWKLRNASHEDQLDALGRRRFEKGLMTEIRQRASRRTRGVTTPHSAVEVISRLSDLGSDELATVAVAVLKSPGIGIFVTEALARLIGLEQLRRWNPSISYQSSPQMRENSGIGTVSDRRSATI